MQTPLISFTVSGLPTAQGSKIPGRSSTTGKLFVREQNSDAQKSWRQDVRQAAVTERQRSGLETLDGSVWVELHFRLPRPQSVSIKRRPYPNVKPDLDKIIRNTLDALKQALIYNDDAQVIKIEATKSYATDDPWHTPGATIHVGLVPPPEII